MNFTTTFRFDCTIHQSSGPRSTRVISPMVNPIILTGVPTFRPAGIADVGVVRDLLQPVAAFLELVADVEGESGDEQCHGEEHEQADQYSATSW